MSNVISLNPNVKTLAHAQMLLDTFDAALAVAINEAYEQGLPSGLVVALLHAHTHKETERLLAP